MIDKINQYFMNSYVFVLVITNNQHYHPMVTHPSAVFVLHYCYYQHNYFTSSSY